MKHRKYGIIGSANGFGGHVSGAEIGPALLRGRGLIQGLTSLGADITDFGDVTGQVSTDNLSHLKIKNFSSNVAFLNSLYEKTLNIYEKGCFPIILGGDHSLSIGTVSAAYAYAKNKLGRDPKIGILWVDAHADLNNPDSSPSGNLHGMPIATLLGDGPKELTSIGKAEQKISPETIVYIGLRDLDPHERNTIKERKITAFTMTDIDKFGIGNVVERSLKQLSEQTDFFIVSFDLDACDPKLAPGVGTAVRGGLTFREAHFVIEMAVAQPKLISFELVELNPGCDMENQTSDLARSLLESTIGKVIL